jgi:glycosyltransferase involved in cell wall biosynthesis
VGRFAPGGHCKRQDVMIESFRKLAAYSDVPLELHLAGALGQSYDDREYLLSLQSAARGLPVRFHVNISAEQIKGLYRAATVYWHCTGIADDVNLFPERFEHFGITIVEAMSAGVIPVVLGEAGPAEIVSHNVSGFLVRNASELEATTFNITKLSRQKRGQICRAALSRAADFTSAKFEQKLEQLLTMTCS